MSDTTIVPESEAQLVERAQIAVSRCNWEVGECAALWTKRFAKGRTDADFAQLVGLSPDQVYQRRRVWETFGDVYSQYNGLKWSHFYSSLTWDDAAECLQWAQDVGATVAEMRAWRRAQRGEDLTTAADDEAFNWMPIEPSEVRIPGATVAGAASEAGDAVPRERDPNATPVAAGFARESTPGPDDYAPFRPDAMTPPTPVAEKPKPVLSAEQLVRRLATTIERCAAAMNDDFLLQFVDVEEKEQKRFLKAAAVLAEKVQQLG